MNFLFHMLLSGADDQLLAGNFMGDFVKGPLGERFAPRIRQGVLLHRRIDSYADHHPVFVRSRGRLSPAYGRYRGVLVDLFYDYYLRTSWNDWSAEPFDAYLLRTRRVMEQHYRELPERLQRLVPFIFDELLPSYATIEGIGSALERMSRRVSRTNPLAGGEGELRRHHGVLERDFREFAPDMIRFAAGLIETLAPPEGAGHR